MLRSKAGIPTSTLKFLLIGEDHLGTSLQKDFKTLLDQLATHSDIGLQQEDDNTVIITYSDIPATAVLQITPPKLIQFSDTILPLRQILLTCNSDDFFSVNLLRGVVGSVGYRIYSPGLSCFLPTGTSLVDITNLELDPNLQKIFSIRGFRPLFNLQNSLVFYAQNLKDNTIHIINRFLLEYYLAQGLKEDQDNQFSYQVAPDLGRFIALQDRGLIPISFYNRSRLHLKKSANVTNLSGLDMEKLDFDVMVSSLFFQYDPQKQTFEQKHLPIKIDKLKKGEALGKYLKNLANLLAVKIAGDLEFEQDKDKGNPLPRLTISIFLDR